MNLLRKTALGTAAALACLLAAAAVVAPLLVNTGSVKAAIERTISRDLGGTLSCDRVLLSVLPRPHIVLRKTRIEVPRKVSVELGSLDIYPSLLPLFLGKFRVATVRLDRPDAVVLLPEGPGPNEPAKRAAPAAPAPSADAILRVAAAAMQGVVITIDDGKLALLRGPRRIASASGLRASLSFLPPENGAGKAFRIRGDAACTVDAADVPLGMITLRLPRFEALPGSFSFSRAIVRVGDLKLAAAGAIDTAAARSAEFDLSGTAGPNAVRWFRDGVSLSPRLTPRSPLAFSDTRVILQQGGHLRVSGRAEVRNGPSLDFDVRHHAGVLSLKRLVLRDRGSEALLSLELANRIADISFSGALSGRTLETLVEQAPFRHGQITGDLKARLPLDHRSGATAQGALKCERLVVPWRKQVPLVIERLSARAEGRKLSLDQSSLSLGGSKGIVSGVIELRDDGLLLDLDGTSPDVAAKDILELFGQRDPERAPKKGKEGTGSPKWTVAGALRLDLARLRGKRFSFEPVRGEIRFEKDRTRYAVREAKVCGVDLAGTATIARGESDLNLTMTALHQDLAPTLACLAGSDLKITGRFDLSGALAARGPKEALLRTLGGTVAFTASKGRVYNDFLVIPIIRYKKVTHLFPRTSDARKNGIPYDSFGIRGTVQGGTFKLDEGVLRSPIMNLAARGDIDLAKETLDLSVLLAPYTTVDAIVRHIPLLGKVLGGTLVTIPLSIEGPFNDPKVTTLPPSALGKGLLGIMKRTLELPFTVIEDLLPKDKDQEGTDNK